MHVHVFAATIVGSRWHVLHLGATHEELEESLLHEIQLDAEVSPHEEELVRIAETIGTKPAGDIIRAYAEALDAYVQYESFVLEYDVESVEALLARADQEAARRFTELAVRGARSDEERVFAERFAAILQP